MKSLLKIIISLILLGFLFTSCNTDKKKTAEKGIIDLSDKPIAEVGITDLSGEWEFYWEQLLSPADFSTDKPSSTIVCKSSIELGISNYQRNKYRGRRLCNLPPFG